MPKYTVWQKREFMFYQEVEANSEKEAREIAEWRMDWEQDDNYVEFSYTVEEEA
jgi:hypothetical protein